MITAAEWDDDMVYPKINHFEFFLRGASHIGALVFFAYNYPALTYGLRYRGVRYLFPFAFGYGLTLLWR